MTGRVVSLWRHPIKGIGRETLSQVALEARAPLPGDRAWALLHENAPDTDDWQARRNFLVVASGPRLSQVSARTGPQGRIALRHPDRPDLTFDPASDGAALVDWVRPLWPDALPAPRRLVRAPAQGMADNGAAQVSILNLSSLRALSERLGQPLEVERFRGNIVLEGLGPWEEFEYPGRMIRIGGAVLAVTERIERCRATEASPATGRRDANTLRALEDGWGHRDFGVYATVIEGGSIATGDEARAQ